MGFVKALILEEVHNLSFLFEAAVGALGSLRKVLAHDCKVVREIARTVYDLHVLLDGRVWLVLAIVGVVLEMAEALWVATDSFMVVHVELFFVFAVEDELVNQAGLVAVVL